jgi:hypothetical protein
MAERTESITQFVGRLSWAQRILIVALILYFVWLLPDATKMVPNYSNVTQTVIYNEASYVPKGTVSVPLIIVGLTISGILIFTFMKRSKTDDLLTFDEVREYVTKVAKKEQVAGNLPSGEINLNTQFYLIEAMPKYEESETIPIRFVQGLTIKNEKLDGLPCNYKVSVAPYETRIKRFVAAEKEMDETDICPNCGSEYSFRTVYPTEVKDYFKLKAAEKAIVRVKK